MMKESIIATVVLLMLITSSSSQAKNDGDIVLIKSDPATKTTKPVKKYKESPWLDSIASSINSFQEISDKKNDLKLYKGKGWKAQLKIKDMISEALQAAANNAWDGNTDSAKVNLRIAYHHIYKNMQKSPERILAIGFIEKYIALLDKKE